MQSPHVSIDLPALDVVIDANLSTITADQPVSAAIQALQQAANRCVLVVQSDLANADRQRLVALFTQSDLSRLVQAEIEATQTPISKLISRQIVTLTRDPTQTLFTALSLLHQHQLQHLPILDEQGYLIGVVTLESLHRALQPAHLLKLGELVTLSAQRTEQERLVTQIAQRIRQSLDLDEILQTTVDEVRQFLQTDRVVLFRFGAHWRGTIAVESVAAEWMAILGMEIFDSCFAEQYVHRYQHGHIGAIANIHTAPLTPCHVELLTQFQVQANLVVPILQGEKLWGLLIAHHCAAPRAWQPSEIELLQHLATQVSIAIQQAELYRQVQVELLERQQAEAALRESEERFRTMADTAPVLIWMAGLDKLCNYFNRRWLEFTGRSLEQELGEGWAKGVHPDDLNFCLENYMAAFDARQSFQMEYRLRRFDGEYRWLLNSGAPRFTPDGQFAGYIGSCIDITDRKANEQTIREQATLIDVATNAIYVCDLDYRLIVWNKGAERLYGWTSEEAIHQDAIELLHQATSQQLDNAYQAILQQGEWQSEFSKLTKSGQKVIVESRWTLVRNDAGQPVSILMVDTDITAKKALESQFLRTQRLESLGTLASGIAHDLNNILTPILAIAQLLPLKLPHLDEQNRALLEMLETNSKRGANLVQQVLSFGRGVEGDRTILQLRHLLMDLQQMVKQTFPKSISLTMSVPSDLWTVSGDATQLHQVFLNLAVNARDAMPHGGTLSIMAENRIIDQQYAQMHVNARAGAFSVVAIADSGTGIPAEILDRIFEPFFTTKELGKGTGLGLSTVIGIVKNHGGFVEVASEVGKGTQFKVFLPALKGAEKQHGEDQTTVDGHGELVLVVDDETAIQEVLKATLEAHHYRVMTASDGIDAIALYATHLTEIQVVLMDVMMPTMDGVIAMRALQRLNPQVKIIAMSGLSTNESLIQDAGVTAFLPKPCTSEELLIALRQMLSES